MNRLTLALAVQHCPAGAFDQNLEATLDIVASAQEADIVVFPEMNLTGYLAGPGITRIARPVDTQWTDRLQAAANRHQTAILTGLAEKTPQNRIHATQLVIRPDTPAAWYRKTHLAPNEASYFTCGNQIPVFRTNGTGFGIQLCYDAHFPELSTTMALNHADLILIPHASPRGTPQDKFRSWMRHLTARAFDNGLFVAALNQTGDNNLGLEFPGVSLVIGPDGHLISKYTGGKETVHTLELDLDMLHQVRSHRMRYFLPNRRADLY